MRQSMKQSDHTLDSPLEDWLAVLRPIPSRNPQAAERGKENFMTQARSLAIPVSKTDDVRHIGWIESIRQLIRNKEYSPMYVTLTTIALVLSLMLGGTGATVYAAQDSLPNQPLYGIKTFSEDLATSLSLRNHQRLQLELDYAGRRVAEMTSLALRGMNPPEPVLVRLEMHLDRVIELAAIAGEGDLTKALLQVRARLEHQIRVLDEAPQVGPVMIRAMEAIQTRLHWVEFGLSEPNAFREQVQVRNQFQLLPEIGEAYSPGPGPIPDLEPGEGGFSPRPGPNPDQEPGEGGFSPGPGPNPDQEPGEGGPGPNSDPEPGECGSGPCPNPDQEPGEGGPGPNSDPEAGECGSGPCPNPDQEPGEGGPGPNSDPEPGESGTGPGPNPDCCSDPETGSNDGENGSNSPQEPGDGSDKGNGGKH